jgi:phosphoribosylanthranilate isomerase
MWIKICGMTTPDAVAAALDAGADAIGFVFAESVRRVNPAIATRLAASARGRVRCVAVTRHPSQHEIDEILGGFRPDVLQTDAADLPGLKLPRELELLPVLRREPDASAALPPRVLFEGGASGTGVTCDWTAAGRVARRSQLVLAGGLNPRNVAAAIAEVVPFGVDVSSGVESRPGVKSPSEIASFVLAARGAALGASAMVGKPGASELSGREGAPRGTGSNAPAVVEQPGQVSSASGGLELNLAVPHSSETAQQSRGVLAETPAHEDPV